MQVPSNSPGAVPSLQGRHSLCVPIVACSADCHAPVQAPKEPAPSEIASSGPTATLTVEVAQEPATNGHAHSRPWWRFWTA